MFNIKKLVVLLLCAGLVFQAHFGIAGPQGGKVVGGNANISQSGPNTTINQTSDRAIINWNSFDIGKNESVRHNMPSSNSAGLHRVVGKGGPSQIEGLLQSNGNIYLVNPAGVVIHNGAKIDVNGFVATSRDITNENFMKGKMVFDKPGLPGAAIINQGNISLRDNGLAALVAPTVRNDGIIAGKLGKVALGGSDAAWKLDMTGDDLIAFTMDEKQVNTLYAADGTPLASVQNNGKIKAEGGVVVLTASQLDGIVGSVVNNGEISAASAEMKGGKIIFRGQGNKVDVVNNGQLDVSSKAADGGNVRMTGQSAVTHAGKIDATGKTKGGNVVITGKNVTLKSGSRIDASGTNGGGTVLVGGNARGKGPEVNAKTTLVQSDAEILADANLIGDGGQIVVWADEKTQFAGKATAKGGENGGDGGMVETSAKLLIIGDPAVVNTSANKGKAGEWLLDPEDFVIAAAGGTMTGQQISDSLENNNVTIKVSEDGEGNGDIFVNDEITWNADTILTLNAYRDIIISNNIKSMGDNGGISIFPKEGNYYIKNSHISLFGKNAKVIINGEEYNIIKSMYDLWRVGLSGLPSGLSKKYVLICDIDLSSENWEAIGTGISIPPPDFSGVLEGFGNSINNLTINSLEIGGYSREWYPSLIASIRGGTIKNLYINNASIISEGGGGILARGISKNSIVDNVHVSGIITIVRDWKEGMGVGCGGILSSNFGIISNSSSDVTINFTDSSPKATIYIGSLVGTNNGIISSSYGTANINVNNVEHNNSSWNRIGGLVGDNYGTINNSYVIGNININSDETYTGGFVGSNSGTIKDSYSVSKIYGGTRGGFVGLLSDNNEYGDANPLIINCYWDTDRSQLNVGSGEDHIHQNKNTIMGLTAHEMCQQSSFKDWNFETIEPITKSV